MYSNSTSKSRTTSNAGIPSTKIVFHGTSKSDPPNLWASSTYDSRSKEMFNYTLLHTRSNSASAMTSSQQKTVQYPSPPTGPSVTAREVRAARTKTQAPPSSFQGSTFISSTEPYRSATTVYSRQPNPSISSMSFGGPINARPSTSRPRTADPNPASSRCNTSTNSGGVISESPASQRINVKSLMSKPTAIPCDRAQSVQSIRPSETEDSDSSDDPHKRRTHSLEILRKTNRRSKSVDLFVAVSRHHSSPLHNANHGDVFEPAQTQKGQIVSSSSVNFGLVPSLARSPSTPGTARPGTNVSDWHDGDRSRRKALTTAKEFLGTSGITTAATFEPSRPLTPASAIALAWTVSQKRNERHERTASVPLTVSRPDPKPSQQTATTVQTSVSGGNRVFNTTSEDDPFLTWRMAERIFTPSPIPNDSVQNGGGAGATMKELSRKVASVLGRPDKSKERTKSGRSLSTNFLPHEEVSPLAVAKASDPGLQPLSGTLKAHPASSPCGNPKDYQPQRSSSRNSSSIANTTANEKANPKVKNRPQLKLGMTEAGIGSSTSRPNSSFHQFFGSESTTQDGSATSPRQNTQFSQSPSAFPTSFPDRPPSRSTTPNTLKKRSRPHLRQKSSNITPVAQPNEETQTVGVKEENGSSTWKGLVRKLSGGNLNRRSSSTDRPPRDVNGQSESGHGHDENVPPVPPLPKNFEIVDPETYLAEKIRGYDGHMGSDNDSVMRGSRSYSQNVSARSSRRSSPVRPIHHSSYAYSDSNNPNSTLAIQSISRRIPRSATDPASSMSESGTNSAPRSPFIQPRRSKARHETDGLQSSNSSTRPSGKDANIRSYGASMLSRSSSDIYSSQNFPSRSDEDRTAVSSSAPVSVSYDTVATTTLASLVVQPIMPPDELYRRGEDEAASLRMRQQDPAQPTSGRQRKTSRPKLPLSEEAVRGNGTNGMHSPASPPPAFSPLKPATLTVPPNPSRKASKEKLSTPSAPVAFPQAQESRRPSLTTTLDVLNNSVNGRHRSNSTPSFSPPVSPDVPRFSTADAINFEPLSARMVNIADQLYQPYQRDVQSPTANQSRSSSAKQELVLTPDLVNGKFQLSTGSDSPSEQGDQEANPPHKKLRVKTSMGTISRVKSVLMRSGSTHTPSSSGSFNTFTPSSGGLSSANGRSSREHSYHYKPARSVGNQTPQTSLPSQSFSPSQSSPIPPVPFTSTAFAFKELPPTKLPSAKQLSDGEREDMWNALLVKSDQAGGTLTVVFHDQALEPSLESDSVSLDSS